jgi:Ni/Co efflux regulator RcnB
MAAEPVRVGAPDEPLRGAAREAMRAERAEARAERSEAQPRFERSEASEPPRFERPASVEQPRFDRPSEQPAKRQVQPEQPRFERPEMGEQPRFERRMGDRPRFDRSDSSSEPAPAVVERRVEGSDGAPATVIERSRWRNVPADRQIEGAREPDGVASWRGEQRDADRRFREQHERIAPTAPGAAPVPAANERWTSDRLRDQASAERWRQDWRRDHRYDWRGTRERDRSRFHIGIYIDPFGWRYRPWQVGYRLPTRFFGEQYWIDDPWFYNLPPVYGPYRWVRYYDDVLLIDLRTGRVVDRITNFFW